MRAIEPIVITTSDGQERRFLLTMGAFKRVYEKLSVKTVKELLALDVSVSVVPILYEALLEKGSLTEESFAEILPAHLEEIMTTMAALLGVSLPDKKAADPRIPALAIQ